MRQVCAGWITKRRREGVVEQNQRFGPLLAVNLFIALAGFRR
jgi:hypothetical protein